MNLTALLGIGIVLSLALGAAGTFFYRSQYEACQASIATEAAKAEAAVNAFKAADADRTRKLEEQLAATTQAIRDQANATQIALAKVPSNPSCARTPAANAFDGSVRPNPKASPSAARPAPR